MFHHVVLIELTAEANAQFFGRVEAFADRIRRTTPNLHRYVFRRNLASRSDGLTHAIISSFATSADHDAYQVSAAHQEMKAYMTPFMRRIVACDIDEDQS